MFKKHILIYNRIINYIYMEFRVDAALAQDIGVFVCGKVFDTEVVV
jgi:hypothetical protein